MIYFKMVTKELEIKHNFSRSYHPQSNCILQNFHSFLKASIWKYILGKLDTEETIQLWFFSVRMLPGIHSKDNPFFLLFSGHPLTPLRKLLSTKVRYKGDERGHPDLKTMKYALSLARKNICPRQQNSDKTYQITRTPDKFQLVALFM